MLVVHRAANGTVLAQGLADVLRVPGADPFVPEVVAVPAKGVERWLAQRLSHVLGADAGDGVCANVEFPSPRALLDDALRSGSPEHAEAVERWSPERAVWTLLDVIDASVETHSWCRPLAEHLGRAGRGTADDPNSGDKGRRLSVAGRLARLFDSYAQARPMMLRAWAAGRDERGDGAPLEPDLLWQSMLWRALRDELGVPSPAELLGDACRRLAAEPGLVDLPGRLSVFGASRISPARLQVLEVLSQHRDVHLWLNHYSPALWEAARYAAVPERRAGDLVRRSLANPLLASMSRDVLELQQQIQRLCPEFEDRLHPSAPAGESLLERLKQDLADDSVRIDPEPLNAADRSIQVHSCHGRARQVEVLREVVLGLLADDPTLEPRDVLVMCPDVETFAPLIAASFSLGDEADAAHPASRLRVRLADRALRRTNPLFAVLSQLLDLGTARITSTQVLDLAGNAAVRRRFGFDDDEVERLRTWTVGTGVRWGLDPGHRAAWQLGGIPQGTWRDGIDRLLLGAAMQDGQGGFGDVTPLDDVDSADIDLAGRFAELVARLDTTQGLLAGRHTAAEWMTGLEDAVLGLASADRDTAWQELQVHGELADIAEAAADSRALIGLADIRDLLGQVLAGRPSRASFRTGTMTVCTLVPMRSVPHRVVCLLGLDDGVFPRQTVRDGDDVLSRDPWIGERDPRSEDRQLLLDAIGATGQHLVITYAGRDERTGAPVPPAVPLGELLDALDRTATVPEGRVRDVVTTAHPLQPFDSRNFTGGALRRPGPFSFDPLGFAGARAAAGPRSGTSTFLSRPLPPLPPADVELEDLLRLLDNPARGFLRQRLEVATTRAEEEPADELPVELDSLQEWAIGDRLLADRVAGLEPLQCIDNERRRGTLPPGPLGDALVSAIGRRAECVLTASTIERAQPSTSVDVDLPLGDGTRLTGTVPSIRGETLLSLTYSKLGPKHRLRAWVLLVVLTAALPDSAWRSVAVGRGRDGAARSLAGPLDLGDAEAAIREIVALYRSGLQSPLPIPMKSAATYAELRRKDNRVGSARTGAERMWEGGSFPGEQAEADNVLVYGPGASLSVLTSQSPWPREGGAGWPAEESDRFGLLSRRLWGRLLEAETTVLV